MSASVVDPIDAEVAVKSETFDDVVNVFDDLLLPENFDNVHTNVAVCYSIWGAGCGFCIYKAQSPKKQPQTLKRKTQPPDWGSEVCDVCMHAWMYGRMHVRKESERERERERVLC